MGWVISAGNPNVGVPRPSRSASSSSSFREGDEGDTLERLLAEACLIPSFRGAHRHSEQSDLVDEFSRWRVRYRFLQDLFDSAPGAYLVTGLDGLIHQANQAAGALFDVDPYFLVGKPLAVFVPMGERPRFRTIVNQLRREGAGVAWDGAVKPRGAAPRPVSFSVRRAPPDYPIKDEALWLIHARTEMDAPVSAVPFPAPASTPPEETSAVVPVTTLGSLARDLRNPLSVIADQAGFLTEVVVGLQAGDFKEAALGLAGLVDLANGAIAALDEVADYAAFRSGTPLALHPTATDLIAVVQRVVGTFRQVNEGQPIELLIEHNALRGIIAGWDEDRLERALGNVLADVHDACRPESPIVVRLDRSEGDDASRALIAVAWTPEGPAGAAAAGARSWDEGRTRGRLRDEGLGMAGARWVFEQLGGSLREEKPGDGRAVVVVELLFNLRRNPAQPEVGCP